MAARIRRALTRPRSVGVPVVCVGNLTVGGAGKTPTVLALVALLRNLGATPHILTRGYRGRLTGPVRVDPTIHDVADVGDEPLLLAAAAPCWVSRNRVSGGLAAVAGGADVIVMDDGFQNPHLRKTTSLLVVDGQAGFGNRMVVPAGPLREWIGDGLRRAHALVVVGPTARRVDAMLARRAPDRPRFDARFVPDESQHALSGRNVVAFAGLARPEKFFAMLREMGCNVIDAVPFPDHHVFNHAEIADLHRKAAQADATLVTTAKDHVRLPEDARAGVLRIDGRLNFDDPARMVELLTATIAQDQPPRSARACGP